MDAVTIIFWFFGAWSVASALLCITRRSPIASALWLVSTMFALAGIFVLLNAEFIAAIQVLVYAGAVMVLFLFVIMLLNVDAAARQNRKYLKWVVAFGITAVLAAELLALRGYSPQRLADEFSTMPAGVDPALVFADGQAARQSTQQRGVVGGIAEPLFKAYLIPFEITSVLLLAAVIGAVVLAKKKL